REKLGYGRVKIVSFKPVWEPPRRVPKHWILLPYINCAACLIEHAAVLRLKDFRASRLCRSLSSGEGTPQQEPGQQPVMALLRGAVARANERPSVAARHRRCGDCGWRSATRSWQHQRSRL